MPVSRMLTEEPLDPGALPGLHPNLRLVRRQLLINALLIGLEA